MFLTSSISINRTINFKKTVAIFILCVSTAFACDAFAADPGITKNEILIGQSCALSGTAGELGKSYLSGAEAYFKFINDNGGIKGRKIRLITEDDGYDPVKCEKNTAKLLETDKVFMLFGYVGTQTAQTAIPAVTKHKIPFFAPMTGADIFRVPFNRYIFNMRPSYTQETRGLVDKLINEKKIKKIAVFYQDDDFGKSGLDGVKKAVEAAGEKITIAANYQRNTIAVEKAAREIASKNPEAVIMIGTYEPCAEFIKQMRTLKSKALYLNISFVGSELLADKLREKGEGIGTIISQVVPFHSYMKLYITREYNEKFEKYQKGQETNEISFGGFIAAKALCKIFAEMPDSMTREDFIKSAETQKNVDLGGLSINIDSTNHQASEILYFTQIGPGGYLTRLENFLTMYEYNPDVP